jgi:hypothetical protein
VSAKTALQQRRPARRSELFADHTAIGTAGLSLGDEIRSRLIDVRLDLLCADSQQSTDLALAKAVQFGEDQRGPLALRELEKRREHLTQILPLFHLRHGILTGWRHSYDISGRPALAQDTQAGVASDPEQPGAQVDPAVVREKRPVSGRERRLNGILGIRSGAKHVAAEGQQLTGVPVVEDLECGRIAATHKRHQSVIRSKAQPRARPRAQSCSYVSMAIGQFLHIVPWRYLQKGGLA